MKIKGRTPVKERRKGAPVAVSDAPVVDQHKLEKHALEQRLLASSGAASAASSRTSRVVRGGVAVMLLLLMAQLLYLYRDQAVVRHTIAAVCEHIGCTVEPVRNPGMISLSNRAFTEVEREAGLYRLQLGLVNQAKLAQSFPQIEISLVDSNGAILARNRFRAADYLPSDIVRNPMAPGEEYLASIILKSSAANVSGFMVDFL